MKIVLLIIASQGYQPIEYGITRKVLEDAGITVRVASDKKGIAQSIPSEKHADRCDDTNCTKNNVTSNQDYSKVIVDVDISAVKPAEYDGIFLIGGPGALECLNNVIVYNIIKEIVVLERPFGAICISPRILAQAGVLKNRSATCWDGDKGVDAIFKKYGVIRIEKSVVVDGNLITADGPQSAQAFGKAIIKKLTIL